MTIPDAVEPVSDDVTSEQYSPIAVAGEQENLPATELVAVPDADIVKHAKVGCRTCFGRGLLSIRAPVSEKPRDDVPIVMKGDSQMRAPHNVIYISGRFQLCSLWDQWRTTDRTHVSEHGWIITHWCYVEELEAAMGG
jgi:hypothetical protein